MTEDVFNPLAVKGHNSEDAAAIEKADILKNIDALYEEATHWADGTDVESQEQHDAVTLIRDTIHELGKKADAIRVKEKEPHDKAAAAVQSEFNPYIQPKKGKVDRAKSCLDAVLARYRIKLQREKDEIARKEREAAEAEKRAAEAAIRESRGNLLAREEAEQKLEEAKKQERFARRAEKDATTRTGLRTIKRMTMPEDGRAKALDWAFERDEEAFFALAIQMATEFHRATTRVPPGFELVEEKVAR